MLAFALLGVAPNLQEPRTQDYYNKLEYMVPMRDGRRLYTSVYIPKDKPGQHPILLERTPYNAGPQGPTSFRQGFRGSKKFRNAGYIFAFQDVRGRHLSEGDFEDIRPQILLKSGPLDIDESTDTFDAVDWLVKNVPNNNGRVGLWGISYPGFYAAVGTINTHPALKASSPQAPVAEWFIGDDFHHHGAFFLQDAFSFHSGFGQPRLSPGVYKQRPNWSYGEDAYKWFLEMGPLKNYNEKWLKGEVRFWNDLMRHGNFDEFWQARSLPSKMRGVTCAVMTVGGMFDAEDCYGAQAIYKATEAQNKGIFNTFVMGPWFHGGWARSGGESFGDMQFGQQTSTYFQEELEFPFFDSFLRGDGKFKMPEALVFETGGNQWHRLAQWPPNTKAASLFLHPDKGLSFTPPSSGHEYDEYVSDPSNPVPYQGGVLKGRTREYMVDDQRFAASRADVLVYQTPPLDRDVVVAGPLRAELFVSTTGTDADFVVKLIDVLPEEEPDRNGKKMAGYQNLIRGEVMRSKFRHSYQNPSPLTPNQVERVSFLLPDILHRFKKGHRIMVQVQSSWFPLVDRNPHKFVDIYNADESDFQKATIRVHHSPQYPSAVKIGLL